MFFSAAPAVNGRAAVKARIKAKVHAEKKSFLFHYFFLLILNIC